MNLWRHRILFITKRCIRKQKKSNNIKMRQSQNFKERIYNKYMGFNTKSKSFFIERNHKHFEQLNLTHFLEFVHIQITTT